MNKQIHGGFESGKFCEKLCPNSAWGLLHKSWCWIIHMCNLQLQMGKYQIGCEYASKGWKNSEEKWLWITTCRRSNRRVLWGGFVFWCHRHTSRLWHQQEAWACLQVHSLWSNLNICRWSQTIFKAFSWLHIQNIFWRLLKGLHHSVDFTMFLTCYSMQWLLQNFNYYNHNWDTHHFWVIHFFSIS